MKFSYFLPFIALLFLKCTPDRGPVKFQMEYFDRTFEISPALNPLETHFFTFKDIRTNYQAYKSDFDLSDDDIVSITPRSFRMTNVSSNDDYNFINEISVKIVDPDRPDTPFEIFYHLPANRRLNNFIDLVPNDKDLKSIMIRDRFTIEVQLIRFLDRAPTSITSRFEFSFDVR